MPYLFYHNQTFTLVSHKLKQGIFYQSYTQRGFSRPSLLHNFSSPLYSAAVDQDGTLHVVSQTSKTQITYFKINDLQVTKQIVLEDTKNNYFFSNLSIQCLKNQVYLFYTVLHPSGNSRSLLCQILTQDPTIYTLIPNLPNSSTLDIYCVDNTISILYTAYEQSHILRHITINDNMNTQDLLHSQLPLSGVNICRDSDQLHLIYLIDNFGRSQLIYVNSKHNVPILLTTSASITNPCILYYLGYIWITYMENQKLYTILSMDNGNTFSSPILCSLQINLDYYTFVSHSPTLLNASSLYASLLNTIRLPIVSTLDTTGIHPDLSPNTELDLLLEGIKRHHTPMPTLEPSVPIRPSFIPPFTSTPSSSISYPSPPSLVPLDSEVSSGPMEETPPQKVNSLLAAKKAFMEQGNGFDAPPK